MLQQAGKLRHDVVEAEIKLWARMLYMGKEIERRYYA